MIDVLNGPQFQAAMKKRAQALSNNIEAAVKKTALGIKADAMRNSPTGVTSGVKKGWNMNHLAKWWYEVKNDCPYAYYVEHGRAPGKMPPVDAIKSWAAKFGGGEENAFIIARAIGKNGTPPQKMLGNAVLKWMPIHRAAIHHAIRKSVS